MKKSKILMPLTAIAAVGTVAPALASCSCNNTPVIQYVTVSFDPDNGQSIYSQEIKLGSTWAEVKGTISKPTGRSSDVEFDFWSLDGQNPIADDYKFEQAVTLKAIYYDCARINFTSTSGGSISTTSEVVVKADTLFKDVELPTATPYTNYYFVGWYYNNEEISPLAKLEKGTYTITATFKTMEEILNVSDGTINKLNYRPYGEFTIPEKIKSGESEIAINAIGSGAFVGCLYLTKVNIGANITTINTYNGNPFADCVSLESINVSEDNTKYSSINKDTHEPVNCIIQLPTTENDDEYILIAGCNTSVIPNYITSISTYAFHFITGITELTIPASCKSVGVAAFAGCINLKSVSFASDDTTISANLFDSCYALESVSLPKNITILPSSIFNDCTSLKSFDLRLYTKLTTIGQTAFMGCESLESIYIAKSITTIETSSYWNPFVGCTNLKSIVVEDGSSSFSSDGHNCIMNIDKKKIITGCQTTTVADTVETIGTYAFYGVKNLTTIGLNNVTTIDSGAFAESGLTSINLSSSIKSIGAGAFAKTQLTSIALPNNENVTIESETFAGIETLTSITVPEKVKLISTTAFTGCPNITSIRVDKANTNYSSIDKNENNIDVLYSISSHSESYGADADLILGSNNATVTIPSYVDRIVAYSFAGMNKVQKIVSEDYSDKTVKTIGTYAFKGCDALESISLNIGFTSDQFKIGAYAFAGCKKLTTAEFKASSITDSNAIIYGDYAFQNCEALTNAFNTSVKRVTFGSYSFSGCKALTSLNFNEMTRYYIEDNAFEYCSNLESVTFLQTSYSTEPHIGKYAFYYCSKLSTLKFDSLTVGDSAFGSCYALTDVDYERTISTWQESLSKNAFPSSFTASTGTFTVINRATKEAIKTNWSCFNSWQFIV